MAKKAKAKARTKTSQSSGSRSVPPLNQIQLSEGPVGTDKAMTFDTCMDMYKAIQAMWYDFNLLPSKDKTVIMSLAFNGGFTKLARDAANKFKTILEQDRHKVKEIVYKIKQSVIQKVASYLNHIDVGFRRMYPASVRIYCSRYPSIAGKSLVQRANRHSRLSVKHAKASQDIYAKLPAAQKQRAAPACAVEMSRSALASERRIIRKLLLLP